jgi:hypothetical protein
MKRALVIYESMYGNTEQIGKAVGDGLGELMPVDVIEVGVAPTGLAADVGHHDMPLAAAYDTHLDHPMVVRHLGSAGASVAKQLHELGFTMATEPEHFWVSGTQGPLREGANWNAAVGRGARSPRAARSQVASESR